MSEYIIRARYSADELSIRADKLADFLADAGLRLHLDLDSSEYLVVEIDNEVTTQSTAHIPLESKHRELDDLLERGGAPDPFAYRGRRGSKNHESSDVQ